MVKTWKMTVGALWGLAGGSPGGAVPTYHGDVAAIVQERCLECHREGGAGPFAFGSYGELVKRRALVREVLEGGQMPPWSAAGGPWADARGLTEEERETLVRWLDGGVEEGDPAEGPEPRVFPEEWHIGGGKPDVVLEFPEAVRVPAEGDLPYEHVVVETRFPEDRWVREVEIIPGEKRVVHHVSVTLGESPTPGGSGIFAVYVPGSGHVSYPEGMAKRLPAGSALVFEMHYTPVGKEVEDVTRLGMVFAESAPEHEVLSGAVAGIRLRIPPGEAGHREAAKFRLREDVAVLSVMPHMHWRGKAFMMSAARPDGEEVEMLRVPRYDFNWQWTYRYAEPLRLPAGTWLSVEGVFDNSADNPANPDPTKTVRWGQQSSDEMLVGYFEYYLSSAREDGS